MKETYTKVELEVLRFSNEDLITASCGIELPKIPPMDDSQ